MELSATLDAAGTRRGSPKCCAWRFASMNTVAHSHLLAPVEKHDLQRQNILEKFSDVRRSGEGWIARCPAHDDRRPSLSIRQGEKRRVREGVRKGRCVITHSPHPRCDSLRIWVERSRSVEGDPRLHR